LASFSGSFSHRILNAFYKKSRKNINNKWRYILQSRSFCERCHKPIKFWYLPPIFGYFFSGRKCPYCLEQIPVKYPIEESLSFLYGLILAYNHPDLYFILSTGFYYIAIYVLIQTDKAFFLIPTESILFILCLGLFESFLIRADNLNSISLKFDLLTAFFWYFAFYGIRFFSGNKLGIADIRLTFALCIAVGYPYSLFLPTLGSLLGIITYMIIHRQILLKGKTKIAFGVYLGFSFLFLRLF